MAKAPVQQSMTLSIRLLRQGRRVVDALRSDHEMVEHPSDDGTLFISRPPATQPKWVAIVRDFATGTLPTLRSQGCGAIIFLQVRDETRDHERRTLALTFGNAHHSLVDDAFERRFGLKVVLNSVARSNLRSLDMATLDATTILRRVQASRNSDLQSFGLDAERDLLTLAAGSPHDSSFARSLSGKDALTIRTRGSVADIKAKCSRAIALFKAKDYKKDFGFIDYINLVRDSDIIDALDAIAFSEIKAMVSGGDSDLHLAVPEIVDPNEDTEIGYYGVGLKAGTKNTYAELVISDYVKELIAGSFAQVHDMATLRSSHEVRLLVDGEAQKKQKKRIYDCFVYEAKYKNNLYVLFDGEWFAVDKAFHESVENFFSNLLAKPFVKTTKAKNERELIAQLDKEKVLLNLDQVKLNPTAMGNANIEPCDFLSTKREFIHLKDGHSSAPISHLWNQGIVSAEAFIRDEKFRVDLREEVKKRQSKSKKKGFELLLPDGRSKPITSDYKVVYGIMRHMPRKTKKLSLPFFSKISLKTAADRLRLMAYNVELHLIEKV